MNTHSYIRQKPGATLMVALGALLTAINFAGAQPLQPEVLFSFVNGPSSPYGALVQGADGKFYGTTATGGSTGLGTVFRVTPNGVWSTLFSFTGGNGSSPRSGLTLGGDGNFYGATAYGGAYGNYGGTVFRVTTNGLLTTLVSFAGTNGAYPMGGLTLGMDGDLYGTTSAGGISNSAHPYGSGTVFMITTNGVLTTLASFNGTNGGYPQASLTLGNDGNFYGTTTSGGITNSTNPNGYGTVFRMTTNGVLTTLVSFAGTNGTSPAGLTLGSDGNFYGTTTFGGAYTNRIGYGYDGYGFGTVFRMTPSGFLTTLVSFAGTNGAEPNGLTEGPDGNFYGTTSWWAEGTVFQVTTNGALTTLVLFDYENGHEPQAALTLGSDGNFYGTTLGDRVSSAGTVFRVTTNGVLTTLTEFIPPDGISPSGSLTETSDGNFYGTTTTGGSSNYGTVFRVTTNGVLTTLVRLDGTNGATPYAGLTLGNDGNLYGTTREGGYGGGTVFQLTTNGTLTTLYSFDTNGDFPDGVNPSASLALGMDGNFYGTTDFGGPCLYCGTVFRITTNGLLTTLASLELYSGDYRAGLTMGGDGNFYGTTSSGGGGGGTVFRVTTNGVLTTLVAFVGTNGENPHASLTLGNDGNLYGTTGYGGAGGGGTVFRVTTNGLLTTLASFADTNGYGPEAALALGSDGNFYGTTYTGGGLANAGTVFQVTTNGVLTTLVSFARTNGAYPEAGLTLGSDGDFYGTTSSGGPGGGGVIYRLRHEASIQSFGMTTNGFQINTLNVGGSCWVVLESSSDLATWTPIQTNGTAAAQTFLDPTALTQPQQFYRVRQQ